MLHDVIGNVPGVMPDAPDERRASSRQPGQADEIQARFAGNAALMPRLAVGPEGVDLQPAVVHRIAGGPDDAGHPGGDQVQLQDRLGQALRVGQLVAGLRFERQVQAIAGNVGVSGIQQRQIVLVATGDVFGKIRLKAHHAAVERFRQPHQGDALVGQPAKIHGMTATGTAHRNGDVLLAGLDRFRIPLAQHT